MTEEQPAEGVKIWRFYEEPPAPPAGVTRAWYVVWTGEPGPGTAIEGAILVDEDGNHTWVPTGEAEPVTITDD